MSVIVKGIKMPRSCAECDIGRRFDLNYCPITGYGKPIGKRSVVCPLEPLPEDKGDKNGIQQSIRNT